MIQPPDGPAAARITIPGVEQNPKNGVSEVTANRGCELTIRLPARILFAEPDNFEFEILSGLSVNHGATFAGEKWAIPPACILAGIGDVG